LHLQPCSIDIAAFPTFYQLMFHRPVIRSGALSN
jgi:hypothetical protein